MEEPGHKTGGKNNRSAPGDTRFHLSAMSFIIADLPPMETRDENGSFYYENQ
ncbi:MAG: hypothetical protein KDK30_12560 [Leptospiraceae bacterium]|nr:hypothetical protein [Leptospiraceae bacterium]MCB1317126.1 hypothetical protein [Leptospiraceae bacterium]